MADIFISYNRADRTEALWIGAELRALGHIPHLHEIDLKGGSDFVEWMNARLSADDHTLCVVSDDYLQAPYSKAELNAALRTAIDKRSNFLIPIIVKSCAVLPPLLATLSCCMLHEVVAAEKSAHFRRFIGRSVAAAPKPQSISGLAVSNIAIQVPPQFMGRDEELGAIDAALTTQNGRVAITALRGMRGVGKTVLAAAYAEQHAVDYRAAWWIRAETVSTIRADLVGLGVRLDWVSGDEPEAQAVTTVLDRLRHEGDRILLIYDNAVDPQSIRPFLPHGGAALIIVTSNYHAWRGTAEPIEIEVWPKEIGADFLIARTGRSDERTAAEALSEALGGLPLAHEQAAAYCERLGISLAEYAKRFAANPAKLMATENAADYDRRTVANTFALAIDEVAKLHPAAEPLIVHCALLAPEPIPLFLFAEGREQLGAPLASALAGDGLDEAVAALRAFALVDREEILDERDSTITTDTIRLHRLVRDVAAARCTARAEGLNAPTKAVAAVYPDAVDVDPEAWRRARRLDALAMALVADDPSDDAADAASYLLDRLATYRRAALASYVEARSLFERALALDENRLGPEHPRTLIRVNNLAASLRASGDALAALPLYRRALEVRERILGSEHSDTIISVNNLAFCLRQLGDTKAALALHQRALESSERILGPESPLTLSCLNNLAGCLDTMGDRQAALPLYRQALEVRERVLGPKHLHTLNTVNNLAGCLLDLGDMISALPLYRRALESFENLLGPEHPTTKIVSSNLADLELRMASGSHPPA